MKTKNSITVIVPIYNAEKYLERCLNSITHQIYKNIEILLIDDAQLITAERFVINILRMTIEFNLYTKKNQGVSKTRNLGIQMAKTDWIMR